jgi:hypothetical protein
LLGNPFNPFSRVGFSSFGLAPAFFDFIFNGKLSVIATSLKNIFFLENELQNSLYQYYPQLDPEISADISSLFPLQCDSWLKYSYTFGSTWADIGSPSLSCPFRVVFFSSLI